MKNYKIEINYNIREKIKIINKQIKDSEITYIIFS